MGIIVCSIINKDLLDDRVDWMPTILKREAFEKRKDSIKLHWYQEKDVRLHSKLILIPLRDIKEKIRVFMTVPNADLLWHTSGIFIDHKAERRKSRRS